MQQNILTVNKITEKVSEKTNSKFLTVEFTSATFMNGKIIKSNLTGTRNVWDEREITLEDGTKQTIKADAIFKGLKEGDLVAGKIIRVDTSDYTIGDRVVNSWKGIIFEGEDAIKYANSQLKSNNAKVLIDGVEIETEADLAFSNSPILA